MASIDQDITMYVGEPRTLTATITGVDATTLTTITFKAWKPGATSNAIEITATAASATSITVTIANGDTADLDPGIYDYEIVGDNTVLTDGLLILKEVGNA